ncbi:MAG: hypothetical protein Q8M71_01635 [Thermodesulfovibrionales bacterium]|nr:hypothetical protein [Thermodesulfovibrionales bacterium]
MKIFFTKKQYEALIKLAYLGDWMANSCKTGNERDLEIEKVEQYIYSFAKDFGMENLLDQSKRGMIFPTRAFEEKLDTYIDEYDDENFWDELIHSLAMRDFVEHYGKDVVAAMEMSERFEKEEPFIQKYEDEFYENGIQKLRLSTDPGCG